MKKTLTPEQKKKAKSELGALHGTSGFSMVYADGMFANSLVAKYGMSINELEIASGYRKARKAKEAEPALIRKLKAENAKLRQRNEDLRIVDMPEFLQAVLERAEAAETRAAELEAENKALRARVEESERK